MWGMGRIGALWAIALASLSCNLGQSQTNIPCPDELIACAEDSACAACLEYVQELVNIDVSSGECDALFSDVCDAISGEVDCDISNVLLLDVAQCVAETVFECPGFTTCDDASSTPTPGAAVETAPPTSGSRGIIATASPTSAMGADGATGAPTGAPTDAHSGAPTMMGSSATRDIDVTPSPTAGSDVTPSPIAGSTTEVTLAPDADVEEADPAGSGGSGKSAALDAAVLPILTLVLASGIAILFG